MNPAETILQLEQALSNFQNTMVDEGGYFKLDEQFLKVFDDLMEKLTQSRSLAEALR